MLAQKAITKRKIVTMIKKTVGAFFACLNKQIMDGWVIKGGGEKGKYIIDQPHHKKKIHDSLKLWEWNCRMIE